MSWDLAYRLFDQLPLFGSSKPGLTAAELAAALGLSRSDTKPINQALSLMSDNCLHTPVCHDKSSGRCLWWRFGPQQQQHGSGHYHSSSLPPPPLEAELKACHLTSQQQPPPPAKRDVKQQSHPPHYLMVFDVNNMENVLASLDHSLVEALNDALIWSRLKVVIWADRHYNGLGSPNNKKHKLRCNRLVHFNQVEEASDSATSRITSDVQQYMTVHAGQPAYIAIVSKNLSFTKMKSLAQQKYGHILEVLAVEDEVAAWLHVVCQTIRAKE